MTRTISIKHIGICIIGMCIYMNICAQKTQVFQGTIQYTMLMQYQNTTDTIAVTCYYGDKYNKAVADFKGMSAQLIQDIEHDTSILLWNMMGIKMAMPLPCIPQDKKEHMVTQATGTDTICQYACKKYLVFSFVTLDSNHISITPSPMLSDTITLQQSHTDTSTYSITINDNNPYNINNNNDISKLLAQNWHIHMWAMLSEDLYINNIMSKLFMLPAHQGIMQFTIIQNNIDINIKAMQVTPCKINKKEFVIDKSYSYTSIEALRSWFPVQP